jgi:hypothetical protein
MVPINIEEVFNLNFCCRFALRFKSFAQNSEPFAHGPGGGGGGRGGRGGGGLGLGG